MKVSKLVAIIGAIIYCFIFGANYLEGEKLLTIFDRMLSPIMLLLLIISLVVVAKDNVDELIGCIAFAVMFLVYDNIIDSNMADGAMIGCISHCILLVIQAVEVLFEHKKWTRSGMIKRTKKHSIYIPKNMSPDITYNEGEERSNKIMVTKETKKDNYQSPRVKL